MTILMPILDIIPNLGSENNDVLLFSMSATAPIFQVSKIEKTSGDRMRKGEQDDGKERKVGQ
jgi:hypothetical protein